MDFGAATFYLQIQIIISVTQFHFKYIIKYIYVKNILMATLNLIFHLPPLNNYDLSYTNINNAIMFLLSISILFLYSTKKKKKKEKKNNKKRK
jgi:hypothetical protein